MNLGSFMPPAIAKMWAKIIIFINNIAIIWELIGGNNLKFAKDWDKTNKEYLKPFAIMWELIGKFSSQLR